MPHASVELEGAGYLSGTIAADQMAVELTGASELHLMGSTSTFEIDAGGACTMDGFDFSTDKCIVDLTGAGEISLTVHEELSVKADGGSTVYYKGDGQIYDQELRGGSDIAKMD